ncbi:MAG: hypothetical protein CMC63_05085 [Flavobacteriaceae bacterium]|nr:hypothetical protein [Flavobacteriaceae bacterium]
MINKKLILFIFIVFIFSSSEINGQCSMCRAVIESEEGQKTAKGINNGILYLMTIPYLLVGIVGWKVYRILKK